MVKRLGVVGAGVVGNAFYEGMKHAFEVLRFDRQPDKSDVGSMEELVEKVDGPIFISLPTPMNPDGSASTKIVEENVRSIGDHLTVIKSTVPPGTTNSLNQLGNVVFNPEFLTEANPVRDFKNQDRIIIGGLPAATQAVANIYAVAYPHVTIVQCDATSAEMVKYVGNCFLATKVSFANEVYQICDRLGIQYDEVIKLASLDKRLGTSHWKVPGPDGHLGFGLTCFPKDINALIAAAVSLGVDPKILRAVWEKNLEVRPEKDWEQMKGRAVL